MTPDLPHRERRALKHSERVWRALGTTDPLWAIAAESSKRGGRWDLEAFFATGRDEVADLVAHLDRLGVAGRRRALDFGCGVGRLSQALAEHFDRVDGVDISAPMVDQARSLNGFPDRVTYHVNVQRGLPGFEDGAFDLVTSSITLQHVPPDLVPDYVCDMARVVAPGGAVVFQLPSHPVPNEPLPEGAYTAHLTPLDDPAVLRTGEVAHVRVAVRNAGDAAWPSGSGVYVGNHWLRRGSTVVRDDGRTPLDARVDPGGEVVVDVPVTAPRRPGRYTVEFDVVHEQVCWFGDRGSPTASIDVQVRGMWRRRPSGPVMEMHGRPRHGVETMLAEAGLDVVDVAPAGLAPGWVDWRYTAVRPASTA